MEILKALVENPVARQDTSYLINVMVSLFSVSDMQEKQYAREAYRLARESDSQLLIDITSISMGALMLKDNKNDSALTYYYQAYWDIMDRIIMRQICFLYYMECPKHTAD